MVDFSKLAMARAGIGPARGRARLMALAVLALGLGSGLAGCTTDGGGPMAFAPAAGGATLAFEFIDGPPPDVFDRLVNAVNSEAQVRSVAVVSRANPAAYRVRGYVSAQVRRGRTVIAWVWDIYDRNQQRALRLRGEEPAAKAGRDAWQAADDAVLRRIASAGMSGVSALLNGAAIPDDAPQRFGQGPAVATLEGPEEISSVRSAFADADR
ncbi:MAG: hypothetical protein QM703_02205 [Gemmatales bacterium]